MRLGMISSRPNLGLDVRLERSVCALLLGKDQDEVGGRTSMAHAPNNGAAESLGGSPHGGQDSILHGEGAEALGNESAIEVMVRATLKCQNVNPKMCIID